MFTPIETSIGAVLLHQATSTLLYQNGTILGASGFLRRLLSTPSKELFAFFAGMGASYFPLKVMAPQFLTVYPPFQPSVWGLFATASIAAIIGFGTKHSNGCTSGHMLCGLGRLSGRSAIAVAVFFPTAIITHHLSHPSLVTTACSGILPCYTPVYPSKGATFSLLAMVASVILAARTVPKLLAGCAVQDNADTVRKFNKTARLATNFFSGLLFALGLHISGMAHPDKVASFLSFPVMEYWDPSLAMVILFGVLPNLIENQLRGFQTPPLLADSFSLPAKTVRDVDTKFILGAAAFGIGWGLAGICPGPAVLRTFFQPLWGAVWIGGFYLGGSLPL